MGMNLAVPSQTHITDGRSVPVATRRDAMREA